MDQGTIESYTDVLIEIKHRTDVVNGVLTGKIVLPIKIAEELCYLQYRMICELIAMGCLIAHEDIKPKSDLYKSYKADWIMNELSKLHPQFFPIPLENSNNFEKPDQWSIKKSGYLTKGDLSRLFNREAGANLHRGGVAKLNISRDGIRMDKVREWLIKLVGLLERHYILSKDENCIIYAVMNDENQSGNPSSQLFERSSILGIGPIF
jgi:hypothetical protein